VLAEQQHKYLSHLTSASTRLITGSDNTHLWSTQEVWDAILNVNLIVSTPQVLLEGLQLGFVQLQRISLLVIDEAHHCVADHPSNKTMRRFYHELRRTNSTTELPCILGMTASPITTKLADMNTLESNLDAMCMSPTQQIEEYREYVHLPKIVLLDYPLHASRQSLPIELMLRILESTDIHEDPWVKHLAKENNSKNLYKLEKVLQTKSTFSMDQLKKLRGNTEHLYAQLGAWPTHMWLRQILLKLHTKVESKEWLVGITDEEHLYLDGVLSEIRGMTCKAIEEGNIVHQMSSKAESLVGFLANEYAENVNISCVIFVERRSTAYALTKLLQSHPSISCTVASFVGSSNSSKKTNLIDLADITTQKAELDEFRSGLRSIVVATSAVEEGIDIQATNLVVLFDDALTVRSYIQRRGRARKVTSKFVVMRSNEENTSRYADFMKLEADMKAQYQEENRQLQMRLKLEDEDENIDRVYAIASTGAQLTFENARGLLEHYCQSLIKVQFEPNPRPTFVCQGAHAFENISAKVILPSSLPSELKEVCGSGIWRTEKLAKRDASYEAVKRLHESGLIDDHLLPPAMAKADAFTVETRAMFANIHPQVNPWFPIDADADEDVLLHVYQCEFSEVPLNHADSTISNAQIVPCPLILLLPMKLEFGVRIPLHVSASHTLQAKVSYIGDRSTNTSSRSLAQEVTLYLIRTTLRAQSKDPEGWRKGIPFFLLPEVPEDDLRDWLELSKRRSSLRQLLSENCSARKTHTLWHAGTSRIHISNLERTELIHKESLFALPNLIPAVLARKLPKRIDYLTKQNLLSPVLGEKKVLDVAECMVLPHLSPSIIAAMQFVPSIIHRVEFALVAKMCCKQLFQGIVIANEPRLLEALTSPLASGDLNYERLEFYGDTLLKLYACFQVYAEPQNSHLPEGYLTMEATKLENNARLQRAAVDIGLDRFMIHERFKPKSWRPETNTTQEVKPMRNTSTKIIADHIEAILAVAYLDKPDEGDTRAVALLNTLLPEIHWNLPTANASSASLSTTAAPSFLALSPVSSILGYHFQRPHLLASSLNHSSLLLHLPTYNRLEFLGDAVLQRIVNEVVYHSPRRFSQNAMHLRQIVCVSHSFLAFLCLGAHVDVPRMDVATDLVKKTATLQQTTKRKYLWEFMTHSNPAIAPAQQRSLKRYLAVGEQIRAELKTSKTYPWTLLASLAAPKFFSDIVESVLGAVYIDSGANLETCAQVLGKLGLTTLLKRLVEEPDLVLEQSKTLLWQERMKKGVPRLRIVVGKGEEGEGQGESGVYVCRLMDGGEVYAEVGGAWCEEEAVLRACEVGLERFWREEEEKGAVEEGEEKSMVEVDGGLDGEFVASQLSLDDEGGQLKRKREGSSSSEGTGGLVSEEH
jgi:ERCC4-related helicase/dsRNA-specific ribonuclease